MIPSQTLLVCEGMLSPIQNTHAHLTILNLNSSFIFVVAPRQPFGIGFVCLFFFLIEPFSKVASRFFFIITQAAFYADM